MTTLTKIFKK